jgi:DNA-binding beta-propeller fold protein YncE
MLQVSASAAAPRQAARLAFGVVSVALALLLVLSAAGCTRASAAHVLVVADLRGHALIVLDPADFSPIRRIDLPGGPHEFLHLPDGRVLVSIEQNGLLVAVDVSTGAVDEIAVGGVPHGLALHGDDVLVTDRDTDTVRRFALDDWIEGVAIEVGAWPHAVGVTPDGQIAVASARAGVLSIGERVHPLGDTTETLAVRADGVVAAAAATDSVVAVFSSDGEAMGHWVTGGRPVRVMFSPDGRTLAVALSAAGSVALIDGDGMHIVPVEGVPDGLAFSPDGRSLYASDVFGGRVTWIDVARRTAEGSASVGEATGALLFVAR